MPKRLRFWTALVCTYAASCCMPLWAGDAKDAKAAGGSETIPCAVIGGMMDTGFWPALAKRFEKTTGLRTEVVAKGSKHAILPAFIEGKADLIVMHSSDAMINLVADGYGVDPQPWARNDLVIAGPADDPAGIAGMTDAAEALRKIVRTRSPLLIQRSLGSQQVLFDIVKGNDIQLDWERVIVKLDDPDRQLLKVASEKHAYVLLGRVPLLNGKIPNYGLKICVQGDPRLRRPYLVVAVNPSRTTATRAAAARRLAGFLRDPGTQRWIAQFRGTLSKPPVFFPVATPGDREAQATAKHVPPADAADSNAQNPETQ